MDFIKQLTEEDRQNLLESFRIEEVETLLELYDEIRMRSQDQRGLDLKTFSHFMNLDHGLWCQRIFTSSLKCGKFTNLMSFHKFINLISVLCQRKSESILVCTSFLYQVFNLSGSGKLTWSELKMMLHHMPTSATDILR